jgi:uncharacterized membrane protein
MNVKTALKLSVYFLIAIGCLFVIKMPGHENTAVNESTLYAGKIIEEISESTSGNSGYDITTIEYLVKLTDERKSEEVVTVYDTFQVESTYHIRAYVGDQVMVYFDTDTAGNIVSDGYIATFKKTNDLIYLLIIFIVLILIIGRMKGLKAIVSLGLTLLLIIKLFIPRLLYGDDPVVLAILISLVITFVTLIIISGFNKKTTASVLGTVGGVLIGGVVAMIISNDAHVIGITYDHAQFLNYIPQEVTFNFSGLLFAAILFGALGAVMDVSMSIASSIQELKTANNSFGFSDLFKAGMNIGKDIMGTMVNTLILAYTGASMSLMILYVAYGTPLVEIFNNDIIATEIIRALAGTIGILIAIPFTAFVAACLFSKEQKVELPINNE